MPDPVTSFTWHIETLERHTATGIVYHVHFNLQATDGTYSDMANGSIPLQAPPAEGYTVIPYDQLTEEQCLSWVKSVLGDDKVTEAQNQLEAALAEKRAPSRAHGKPWA